LASRRFIFDVLNENSEKEAITMNENIETQSAGDTHSNLLRETVFYAIYIPQDSTNEDGEGKMLMNDKYLLVKALKV